MKFSTAELVILILSTILQLVCLVAPGWWIETYSGSTMYEALFYIVTCANSQCETMSWRDYWVKQIPEFYDYRVRQQIFLIVAMVTTVLCLTLHVVRRRRPTVSYLLVIITTCSCMVGSGALMIWNLSDYYIMIHAIQAPDIVATFGFPYCVLMYSLALLGNAIVLILFVFEVVREHRQQSSQGLLSGSGRIPTTNTVSNEADTNNAGLYSRFS